MLIRVVAAHPRPLLVDCAVAVRLEVAAGIHVGLLPIPSARVVTDVCRELVAVTEVDDHVGDDRTVL